MSLSPIILLFYFSLERDQSQFIEKLLNFSVQCSQEEERLVRDLFRGYNKLIRPVQNMTQKVEVSFGLAFIQLINVNEKNQIMKSNVWLRLVSFIHLYHLLNVVF